MTELSISNPATIKAYFEKVRQLHKAGNEFPVNLEEVWPLVYARKDKAVDTLKKGCVENVHYQVFHQKGENPKGGRPELSYKLSVGCMEFFIAGRIPEVFEVYRQVFHQAMDKVEAAVLTPAELLLAQAQQLVNQERRLSHVENKVDQILAIQQEAAQRLLEVPRSNNLLPEQSTRSKVQQLVNGYCNAFGLDHPAVWRKIYDRLYYLYRVSIRQYRKSERESLLDVAERTGHMEKIYAIASAELVYDQYAGMVTK